MVLTTTLTINSGRSVENIIVIVNGVTLVPSTDYSISGTTLTFIQFQHLTLKFQ